MSEELKAKIAEQAREIERLHKDYDIACDDAMSVARKLPALKAQPSAVVLPGRMAVPGPLWSDTRQPYGRPLNYIDIAEANLFNMALDEVTRLNATRAAISAAVNTLDDISRRSDARQLRMEDLASRVPVEPAHSKAVLIDRELFDGSEV